MKKGIWIICLMVWIVGCGKPRSALLTDPGSTVTSISGSCLIVENSRFPETKAWVYIEDQNQTPQTDFAVGNFNVSEEGVPEVVYQVNKLDNNANPLYAVIVLDQSGSMSGTVASGDSRMTVAKTAAKSFVSAMGALDQAAVILFDNNVVIQQSFTSDKTALNAAIDAATPTGSTAVYEATGTAIQALKSKTGRKVIVTLTDGSDNASTNYSTTESVYNAANEQGIPVFTFGITTGTGGSADPTALRVIAEKTGAKFFSDADGDLGTAFTRVMTQMNHLVEVQFRSLVGKKPRTMKIYLTYGFLTTSFERIYSF